ncbi:hypothetical protein Daesc_010539 [Daldinia eschscholtzii]|uniref:DUF1996 domain-containing protein n=1 Tax=Daldinia eschscholtzii TaxID=292717 RepID=A0AAX6M7V9_9PEZI
MDIPSTATCTTCTFAEDFSNYWTAVMFFRARNGTYKRVQQKGNVYFEDSKGGGMTIYYIPSYQNTNVTAFKPLTYCWDGVNLDSPDHASHVSYPESGTFEEGGPCPASHPVKIPQLFYEIVWDTTPFNDKSEWPEDGSQPFVWSYGDATGFGNHGDYMFGWKGNALQIAMDTNCNGFKCPELQYQEIKEGNKCSVEPIVDEDIDGCKYFDRQKKVHS